MKAYHLEQSKYWANTARQFYAAGYRHMSALFQQYSEDHATKANSYAD